MESLNEMSISKYGLLMKYSVTDRATYFEPMYPSLFNHPDNDY